MIKPGNAISQWSRLKPLVSKNQSSEPAIRKKPEKRRRKEHDGLSNIADRLNLIPRKNPGKRLMMHSPGGIMINARREKAKSTGNMAVSGSLANTRLIARSQRDVAIFPIRSCSAARDKGNEARRRIRGDTRTPNKM